MVKRVLLIGDNVGGVWTFTLELAEGLLAQGIDVCLATSGRAATPLQCREAGAIRGLLWLASAFKLEWMEDPWEDVEQCGRWLLEVAWPFKPDVVHLNTLCHAALEWDAPVVLTVHSCVASWWRAVKGQPLPPCWSRYRSEVERSLGAANMVTAPSAAMLGSIRQNYAVQLRDRRVVPNGRRRERFYEVSKEPFVLAAGRLWDEGKNIKALTNVAPTLPWPVYLAGEQQRPDGTGSSFLGCTALGQLSTTELASWYARAAIYVLPARYEPFGLSVLEAALSGCALVLGDIPTLREVWQDAAIFVSPDATDRLQSALQSLMKDPAMLQCMAARARERAHVFTQQGMVAGYLGAYRAARGAEQRRHACVS